MSLFPKSGYRILKLIYENPGIRLNELIKKARVSSETAKKRLNSLLNLGIITENRIVGKKRVILKNLHPNFSGEEGRNVFSLIESEKKQEFFKKNKNLIGPFKQILKNIDGKVKVVLVFGSFANNTQTEDSDLDILFLISGKINESLLKKEIERSFITFNHEISPRIDTLRNFRKNIDKGVYQTIIKNHIILKGILGFIESISEY